MNGNSKQLPLEGRQDDVERERAVLGKHSPRVELKELALGPLKEDKGGVQLLLHEGAKGQCVSAARGREEFIQIEIFLEGWWRRERLA